MNNNFIFHEKYYKKNRKIKHFIDKLMQSAFKFKLQLTESSAICSLNTFKQ